VECHEFVDRDIGYPVAVCQKEGIRIDILFDLFDPRPGHGSETGSRQGNLPIIRIMSLIENDIAMLAEIDSKIAVSEAVAKKIVFDGIALVYETDNKPFKAIMPICFHDMPQDGFCPDRYHRLRHEFGLFPEPGSHSTRQYDNRHQVERSLIHGVYIPL
jgi:hypothetical protein